MADQQSRCAYCGKPAHKVTRRIYNPHTGDDAARKSWDYRGNERVIKRDWHWYPTLAECAPGGWCFGETPQRKWLASVSVWDGESWALAYDPFCSLRCAQQFGRAAYRAGYRIEPARAA